MSDHWASKTSKLDASSTIDAGHRAGGAESRRRFLECVTGGFGSLALSCLLHDDAARSAFGETTAPSATAPSTAIPSTMVPRAGHFPAKAKSVILLFQNGGPSQMDLCDYKPELQKRSGQFVRNIRGGNGDNEQKEPLMGSAFQFRPHGQSGLMFSELIPNLASLADDLCVVRSMYSTDPNHPGATYMMCSCSNRPGRPTLGAWTTYALGSDNQNLPGFVLLRDPAQFHSGGAMQVTNGWLPAMFRATEVRDEGSPVLNLNPNVPRPKSIQDNNFRLLSLLNHRQQERYPDESRLEARIQNYELAARMQLHAMQELDLSHETAATQKLYGLDDPVAERYGRRLLMARRLVERGVRFVQVLAPAPNWDHHDELNKKLPVICRQVDQASAGLITDLKQRGLLDQTLVIWAGEFGRLPTSQRGHGRNHNPHGFSILMAGGGLRGGLAYGATDDFGYAAVEQRVGVPDLFATILHQLGLDHARVSFLHNSVEENVVDTRINKTRVISDILT